MNTEPSFYQMCVDAGATIGNHESDLQVRWSADVQRLIDEYNARSAYRLHVRQFLSQRPGECGQLWIEVPFGYVPWWTEREEAGKRRAKR